jgi:formylmethanofuran dehydrogenase subunit C
MRSHNPADRYAVTDAGFLFCQDCGSLVMEGYRAEHDDMHGGLIPATTAAMLNGQPMMRKR